MSSIQSDKGPCVTCGGVTAQRCPRGCGAKVHKIACDRDGHRAHCVNADPSRRRPVKKPNPGKVADSTNIPTTDTPKVRQECVNCGGMTTGECTYCRVGIHSRCEKAHHRKCWAYEDATVKSMEAVLASSIVPLLLALDFDVNTYDELVDLAYGDRPGRWPDRFVADWTFVSIEDLRRHQMTI